MDLSQTWIATIRGSGTVIVPTWLIGIDCPYAWTITGSSRFAEALPVRSPESSCLKAAIAPSIRFLRISRS